MSLLTATPGHSAGTGTLTSRTCLPGRGCTTCQYVSCHHSLLGAGNPGKIIKIGKLFEILLLNLESSPAPECDSEILVTSHHVPVHHNLHGWVTLFGSEAMSGSIILT